MAMPFILILTTSLEEIQGEFHTWIIHAHII